MSIVGILRGRTAVYLVEIGGGVENTLLPWEWQWSNTSVDGLEEAGAHPDDTLNGVAIRAPHGMGRSPSRSENGRWTLFITEPRVLARQPARYPASFRPPPPTHRHLHYSMGATRSPHHQHLRNA